MIFPLNDICVYEISVFLLKTTKIEARKSKRKVNAFANSNKTESFPRQ